MKTAFSRNHPICICRGQFRFQQLFVVQMKTKSNFRDWLWWRSSCLLNLDL